MITRSEIKGYTIRQLREITGCSQSRFALVFNIPLNSIINWENRRRTPPIYVLEMLERIISVENAERYKYYALRLRDGRKYFLSKLKAINDKRAEACQVGTQRKGE